MALMENPDTRQEGWTMMHAPPPGYQGPVYYVPVVPPEAAAGSQGPNAGQQLLPGAVLEQGRLPPGSRGGGGGGGSYPFYYGPSPDEVEDRRFKFNDATVRRQFVQKVYSIVFLQLMGTVAVVLPFIFVEDLQRFSRKYPAAMFIGTVLAFGSLIALSCGPERWRRKSPINLILLAVFTLGMGFTLGIAVGVQPKVSALALALGVTAGVVLLVTLLAFFVKIDLTRFGGFLLMALLAFVLLGVVIAIVKIFVPPTSASLSVTEYVFSGIGVFLFCGLLAYDTQLLVGGKHRYAFDPEDYVSAAVCIYLDILNIFTLFYQIFSMSDA